MIMLSKHLNKTLPVVFSLLLIACGNEQETPARETLETLKITKKETIAKEQNKLNAKSESEIREAYINYLKHASKQDLSRSEALNRLANIEFSLSERAFSNEQDEQKAAQLANQKLQNVVDLLETSLKDYPKAKHNDSTLYQLAKAYDQLGQYKQSQQALAKLAEHYPKSPYYIEAQFRLAEYAFSSGKYRVAEDKYTEVIINKKNTIFFEKALYKRGWSRFKQEYYFEAADDFLRVIKLNEFTDYQTLTASQKNLFDEYFRAMGLAFSYLDGAPALDSYLQTVDAKQYTFYLYQSLSSIQLKQERYNDAALTLNYFAKLYPNSYFSPQAGLQVIEIWKQAGFLEKRSEAFNQFYLLYHPESQYWKSRKLDKAHYQQITMALKAHILTETATYHQLYDKKGKQADYLHAKKWYINYLNYYEKFSRQDNIHQLVANLYLKHGDKQDAFKHFQLAGFDGQTIINKDSAYQAISLGTELLELNPDNDKQINNLLNNSTLYVEQYPTDKNSLSLIAYMGKLAYQHKHYKQAIQLAESVVTGSNGKLENDINFIKAQSYIQIQNYQVAEQIYAALANNKQLTKKQRGEALQGQALAIFKQGDVALKENKVEQAIQHYGRIYQVAPHTESAASGLYDAIALSIEHQHWLQSIQYGEQFRKLYPTHKYSTDITKKLSVAYLNSKQDVKAAKELERLSGADQSREYKMASLLKAAQLYSDNKQYKSAIRSFEKYAKQYTQPFPDYLYAMDQLAQLNEKLNSNKKRLSWYKKIITADKQAPNEVKNNQTKQITANASMVLAEHYQQAFSKVELKQPLKKNLLRKKKFMQNSVNYYAKASSYGFADKTTQATYNIAKIYNDFSQALLNSEVPAHLNEDEQEQYTFLLEDQAFSFEEKAIEFHEVNLRYSNDGIFDKWVQNSLTQLQQLFPLRYKRSPKVEEVINVLH